MDWYIRVNGAGDAVGYVLAAHLKNPLTSPSGDKVWYKAATLDKPDFNSETQKRTGPVYDIENGTITYTVTDKTAQELGDEKESGAVNGLNMPFNKTLRDALFNLHQLAGGSMTKAEYTSALKDTYKGYL